MVTGLEINGDWKVSLVDCDCYGDGVKRTMILRSVKSP